MNFILKPSLQHIAVVKVVSTLWIQDEDIVEDLFSIYCTTLDQRWNKVENKLIRKVKILALPKTLERKLLDAIKPMGDEIIFWRDYHARFISWFDIRTFKKNFHNICWTSQGTVDRKKTAEMWIRDEELDVFKRYELACIYCLENDIPKLCDQLHESEKEYLCTRYITDVEKTKLVLYWTIVLNKEFWMNEISESALYRYAVLHAAEESNKVAIKYFLEHPGPEEDLERNTEHLAKYCLKNIDRNMCKEYFGEILCFLLSHMNDEQQLKVFENGAYAVLKSLLDWPRQCFFLETANRTWEFLPVRSYCQLLFIDILNKIKKHYKDCNYREIFMEFWQQSPLTYKRYVFDEHSGLVLLFILSECDDAECIQWILKDATIEEKMKLIGCTQGQRICKHLINSK